MRDAPGDKRHILEAFVLYCGKGENFDLSQVPPQRERFAFGGNTVNPPGYRITEACTACGLCLPACPQQIVSEGEPYHIVAVAPKSARKKRLKRHWDCKCEALQFSPGSKTNGKNLQDILPPPGTAARE